MTLRSNFSGLGANGRETNIQKTRLTLRIKRIGEGSGLMTVLEDYL